MARQIVEKWRDTIIPNFRVAFNKLEEQLKEMDGEKIDVKKIAATDEPTEEQKASAME